MSPSTSGKRRNVVPPEVRAAVIAALLAGDPISVVSSHFSLPEGTVKSIKARLRGSKPIGTPRQQEEMGELVLEALRENQKAVASLARLCSDHVWQIRQGAEGVALLYGILSDKGVRLLEALAPPQSDSNGSGDGEGEMGADLPGAGE